MILTRSEHWLLLNNDMSMCEMLNGIYELAVMAIVIMNTQEKVINTCF